LYSLPSHAEETAVSRSLNKAMLIGNIGSDPEIRTTTNGARVAQFSLATNRRWNDRNGQQQEKTEWHRIVVWDKPFAGVFEVVERYVRKGERLYVEGEIEYRQYQDKDGNTRFTTEIRAREVLLLGGRPGEGGGEGFERGGGGYDRGARAGGGGGGGGGGARAGAAAGGGGGGGGGGARGGSDYDDFNAPPIDEDDDLPF
jgi:single-strand DNA-binding protein